MNEKAFRENNMEIRLDEVNETEKEILYRLLQFSLYEESAGDGNEMTREAVFAYPWFDAYFTEDTRDDRSAYLIREAATGKLLGFVMINIYLQQFREGHNIAEFLVIPKYRRKKVGKQAAFACFDRFGGNWEVSPAQGSDQAYLFWKHIVEAYTNGNYRFEEGIFLFSGFVK